MKYFMVRQVAPDLFRVYEQKYKIEIEIGMLRIDDENHFVLHERTSRGYDSSKMFTGLSASVCINKMLGLNNITVNYDYMTERKDV